MLVVQSCSTLCDSTDCSPPGSSIHGIFQQEYWNRLPVPSPEDPPNSGIFPTQGSNPGLPHYRQTLYHLSHKGSPGEKIDGFKVKVTLVSGWTQANNLLRQLWKHSQRWEVNKKQGDKIKGIFLQKSGQILIRMP